MSITTSLRNKSFSYPKALVSCPYRVRQTSDAHRPSAVAWCAHHDFSDNKNCNPCQPCSVIATIASNPDFYIQTALLWVRSSECGQNHTSTTLVTSGIDRELPVINIRDAVEGRSHDDSRVSVHEDLPDLGLLHLHRDRLAAAAEALGWHSVPCLRHDDHSLDMLRRQVTNYMEDLPSPPSDALESRKVRILINKTGKVTIDSSIISVDTSTNLRSLLIKPWIPTCFNDKPLEADRLPCTVYLDHQPSRPSTLTSHKTTHRCVYTTARERLNMTPTTAPTAQEVLLYNPYGEIMETSCCTIYFKRAEGWITPATICGPTLGVTRRLAIEKGICRQGTIELRDLTDGEEVWLSNAVRGFFRGTLTIDTKKLHENVEVQEMILRSGSWGTNYMKSLTGQ